MLADNNSEEETTGEGAGWSLNEMGMDFDCQALAINFACHKRNKNCLVILKTVLFSLENCYCLDP